MADALCGPSNPLQSFQKHSSVDRTLQRDRLLQRNDQNEGFRTNSGPNAGILDAEFEAFQAGVPPGAIQPHAPLFSHEKNAPSVPQRFAQAGPSSSAAWASDFSRLHIGTPPPPLQQRQPSPAQMQSSQQGPVNWYNDFQRVHTPPQFQSQQQWAAPSFQSSFPYTAQNMASPFQQSQMPMEYTDIQQSHMMANESAMTEAWSQAFDDIGEQLLREEKGKQAATELMDEDPRYMNSHDTTDAINTFHEPTVRFNPDVAIEEIQREHEEEQDQRPLADDELAMTAGELLDRVADNKTEKFQQSSFLSLMRKLRDYEVKVEGDKMVDVEGNALDTQIPVQEQDEDLGRDAVMAGALRPASQPEIQRTRTLDNRPGSSGSLGLDTQAMLNGYDFNSFLEGEDLSESQPQPQKPRQRSWSVTDLLKGGGLYRGHMVDDF